MTAPADIRVVDVTITEGRKDFLRLPLRLYRGQPGYAPALLLERAAAIDPRKNPYFKHAEVALFVAYRGNEAVGRISAQIDRLAQGRHGHDLGHFGSIDAIDDPAVYRALFSAAEAWLTQRGVTRVQGPFSLTINEETGLMIDGFKSRPMLMMAYHPPYAAARVEALGYAKAKDTIAYDYDVTTAPPIENQKLIDRAHADLAIKLRHLDMKHYRRDLDVILGIFNDAWADNWGFVPMTEDEIAHTAHEMKPIILPDMVWIAEVDGEPASMIVCLPNVLEATADLDGRILPFGWAKLLWRLKVAGLKSSRVPLFGLRKKWHRSPYGAAIIFMLLDQLRLHGVKHKIDRSELSWILEDNTTIRKIIQRVGGRAYKTFRVYEKRLTPS